MSDHITIKHETILELGPNQGMEDARRFNSYSDDDGKVVEAFYMSRDDWTSMGEPEVITVTVVPGDTLNV